MSPPPGLDDRSGETPTARARRWLSDVPEGSVFLLSDVPAPPGAASPLLSRAVADPSTGICRVGKGVFGRERIRSGVPFPPDPKDVARRLAGPGGGLGEFSAAEALRWTRQMPRAVTVAVVGRAPRSPSPSVRFVSRGNTMRRGLTWAEVTLLEAARVLPFLEVGLPEACWRLARGFSLVKMPEDTLIRKRAVLGALPGERGAGRAARRALIDLCDAMPEQLTQKDRARPGQSPFPPDEVLGAV